MPSTWIMGWRHNVKFCKQTQDHYFTITVESNHINNDPEDNEEISAMALSNLVLELRFLASSIAKLLEKEVVKKPH